MKKNVQLSSKRKKREAQHHVELSFINLPEFDESYNKVTRRERSHQILCSPITKASSIPKTPTSSTRKSVNSSNNTSQIESTPKSSQLNDSIAFKRPPIRKTRNVLSHVKDAIATTSYEAAVSVEKARVAFQVIARKMYGHRYYLTKEEQAKYEPTLQTIEEHSDELEEPKSKKPRTLEEYKSYEFVLPDRKVVGDYKHTKAMQQEVLAAKALSNKAKSTRVTLHYDTTSRCRIKGDWPSIILNFLDDDKEKCCMYNLRTLFFAYEDPKQIAKLITETLKRLSVATGGAMAAVDLWCNIYAFMTDSVTKNLEVEKLVSETLGTDYVPIHILCKSHVCEKIDE